MNDRITIYICGGCGRCCTPDVRWNAIVVECHEIECANFMKAKNTRMNISDFYTAVSVDIELAAKMIEAIERA